MENIKFKFDFDDILIVPSVTTKISSRYKDIKLPENLPLFTAPMDTVVNLNNMKDFLNNGINVALPRTISHSAFINEMIRKRIYTPEKYQSERYENVFVSVGFEKLDAMLKISELRELRQGARILIDVANGHMEKIVDYCKKIKQLRPDIIIMVGNIANPQTYRWYAESKCVDYIRVGIGNGNGCLTTKQSGIGHPMASLIYEVRQEKLLYVYDHHDESDLKAPAIVADGGMKDYSDIIKSLALGADYVMIGSIFNKAFESAAANYLYGIKLNKKLAKYFFDKGYPVKKYFRGMSTKEAQKAMGKTHFKTSEGVTRIRKVEYHLDGWVENFEHYLRNMMSYVNAKTLEEFIGRVEICQISKNAYDRFNK
jgi:IMP dehydrogenase/GMP reductase